MCSPSYERRRTDRPLVAGAPSIWLGHAERGPAACNGACKSDPGPRAPAPPADDLDRGPQGRPDVDLRAHALDDLVGEPARRGVPAEVRRAGPGGGRLQDRLVDR